MPARFESEALKAQAVASYTYFCKLKKNATKNQKYDFKINAEKCINFITEEQMHKKWGDEFQKYYQKIKQAVDSVFGEVIQKNGEIILATYHAMSSGKTEKSSDIFGEELDYLINVDSPGDKLVTNYETKVVIDKDNFKNILSRFKNNVNFNNEPIYWLGKIDRTNAGSVKNIEICSECFKGVDIRNLFNLRSSNFQICYDSQNEQFVFTVLGYGHGVGMSQCGANYMAQQGDNYKKILKWYYPNTDITLLN